MPVTISAEMLMREHERAGITLRDISTLVKLDIPACETRGKPSIWLPRGGEQVQFCESKLIVISQMSRDIRGPFWIEAG